MTKLEYLKKQHNLSSAKLSLAAGINYTLLTSIERGERKAYPKVKKRLAEFFNVAEDELFNEDGSLKEIES
ncbi:helix-turn-helix domain-containing protein [Caldicellulosiruptor sp. DIB 104C]|uniref:helix-turn-helix domain-containing protein n=1 Tax=Caldicellulosiruptor sp. DIB 104C TaxID=3019889 RepID=UPI002304FD80|nr:helix-turn-helix transcriptional regulator [Caldicellulosiruptor sp. DIB 104C]